MLICKAQHVMLFYLHSLVTSQETSRLHQDVRTHPLQLLYILQYLCCPNNDPLENISSIFGRTGISCQSVRVIDIFVAGLHGLSFCSALCELEHI